LIENHVDHCQLPPTITSNAAAKTQPDGSAGLELTLFDRMLGRSTSEMHDDAPVAPPAHAARVLRMLTIQYRMNRKIMQWASDELYQGRLDAADQVADHLLCQLPNVASNDFTTSPLILIDTAFCAMDESSGDDDDDDDGGGGSGSSGISNSSKSNEGEAGLVQMVLQQLLHAGVSEQQIAVITPYNAQVELLRSKLSEQHPKLEIGSVDGFQGREKEAVVCCLTPWPHLDLMMLMVTLLAWSLWA
jgi:DNA polymerase alpha-associated DNA helicase A